MKRTAILTVILGAILGVILAGCAVSGGPDPLDAVRVESTRQAVAFQAEHEALDLERERLNLEREQMRAQSVDAFLMALPWIVLACGLLACGALAWHLLPVFVARYGLVTRKAEDGESLLLLGKDRLALPMRMAGPYADLSKGAERSPMLAASIEAQEAATMRQQAGNLALASQAAETVKARKGGDVTLMLPHEKRGRTAPAAPSPVRVLPEPTREVAGWIVDTERALLPEVVSDGDD